VPIVNGRVIIVGAGIAGVAAAQRLLDAGIEDFLILESRHEVGGRMATVPFGGFDLQPGSGLHWIHQVVNSAQNR
jgi:polyamine oxidase